MRATFQAGLAFTLALAASGIADAAPLAWQPIGIPGGPLTALEMHPSGIVWSVADGIVYRSADGGQSWQQRSDGLPRTDSPTWNFPVTWIVTDPFDSSIALCGSLDDVWRTGDGGLQWSKVLDFPNASPPPRVSADESTAGSFYLARGTALRRSLDHGVTWQSIGIAPPELNGQNIQFLAADPDVAGTVYARASSGPLVVTTDAGQSWSTRNASPPCSSFVIGRDAARTMYCNGSSTRSTDHGASWEATGVTGIVDIATDASDSALVYAVSGSSLQRSSNAGASWQPVAITTPGATFTLGASAVACDPSVSGRLIVGTSVGPLASNDSGATWAFANTGFPSGNDACSIFYADATSTIYAIVGSILWRSTDLGAHWIPANPPAPSPELLNPVHDFAIAPSDDTQVWAATGNGIYRSDDGGASWTASNTGIANLSATEVEISRADPQLFFAVTSSGTYRSQDGGASWNLLSAFPREDLQLDPFDTDFVYVSGAAQRSSDGGLSFHPSPGHEAAFSDLFGGTMRSTAALDPHVPGRVFFDASYFVVYHTPPGQPTQGYTRAYAGRSTDRLESSVQMSRFGEFLVGDPSVPNLLYAPDGYTDDGGTTFHATHPAPGPATCAIAISASTGRLFAGMHAGWPEPSNLYTIATLECSSNADCDVSGECVTGICDDGRCSTVPSDDGGACSGYCGQPATCSSGSCGVGSCNDTDNCTNDYCGIGTGGCVHTTVEGCESCTQASDCDDGDGCTNDYCGSNGCYHTARSCQDSDECTVDACEQDVCSFTEDLASCSNEMLLADTKLVLKRHGEEITAKLKIRDEALPIPGWSPYYDPSARGLSVKLFFQDGSTRTLHIPGGAGWSVSGIETNEVQKYRNDAAPGGPSVVRSAKFTRKSAALSAQGGAALPAETDAAVGVRVSSGNLIVCGVVRGRASSSAFSGKDVEVVPDCSDASLVPLP